ncbi:MAG: JAB domain-containing protein [Clostridia bacterium]|nr:JAB domain-containing protein [Clostridia bacterium]
MENENINLHKNHRKRLLDIVSQIGFENANDYVALEFILTYIIPRKDTNPTAHMLIKEFGNLASVFDADINQLKKIDGIGEHTAKLITMLPHIANRYFFEKKENKKYLITYADMAHYYTRFMQDKTIEEFCLTCLDDKFRILNHKKIGQGELTNVNINPKEIASMIVNTKNATKIIISHCHPDGSCMPSSTDIMSTNKIMEICKLLGIKFVDHIIVGNNGCYSFSQLKIIGGSNEKL